MSLKQANHFLKEHGQLSVGIIVGILVAQIAFYSNFHPSPDVAAAIVSGCFTLLAALIAICVGYISYRTAHVPFEKKRSQSIAIIKNFILNNETIIKIAREEINKDNILSVLVMARRLCDVEIFCFEKEFLETLPEEILRDVLSIREDYNWLRSQLSDFDQFKKNIDSQKYKEIISDTLDVAIEIHERAFNKAQNF